MKLANILAFFLINYLVSLLALALVYLLWSAFGEYDPQYISAHYFISAATGPLVSLFLLWESRKDLNFERLIRSEFMLKMMLLSALFTVFMNAVELADFG